MSRRGCGWRAIFVLCALGCVTCRREPKRVVRTEPWPAPALGSAGNQATRQRLPYQVVRGTARIELGTRRRVLHASVSRIEGTIEWDRVRFERTRAVVRADLLSLSVATSAAAAEDPSWTAQAFDWLQISAQRPSEERERDRWAELRVLSLDAPLQTELTPLSGKTSARAELTLHHFRLPVLLELEIEVQESAVGAPSLSIRTSRPLVVPLTAHDILPRDASGALLPSQISALGSDVAREARVSVEIFAQAAADAAASPPDRETPVPHGRKL